MTTEAEQQFLEERVSIQRAIRFWNVAIPVIVAACIITAATLIITNFF